MNVEKIIFDITSLEPAPGTKVNFSLDKLSEYKGRFVDAVKDADAITLTGPGPAWLHLCLWHEAHGRVAPEALSYEAPGVSYVPIAAGVATGDGSMIKDGRIVVDISKFEEPDPTGRVNLQLAKVNEYQRRVLGMLPAFKVGEEMPEFEIVLTGAGPVWLFLALVAACHSRGGTVVYSAPNCPRCVIVDHK